MLEALFAAARSDMAAIEDETAAEELDADEPETAEPAIMDLDPQVDEIPAVPEMVEEDVSVVPEPPVEAEKSEETEKVLSPEDRKQTRMSVEKAFEKLAKKLKQPTLAQADNRYPMYVIFSSQVGLERKYGRQTRSIINKEMNLLAEEIRKRP